MLAHAAKVSDRIRQKRLDHGKQSATDALKTSSKRVKANASASNISSNIFFSCWMGCWMKVGMLDEPYYFHLHALIQHYHPTI